MLTLTYEIDNPWLNALVGLVPMVLLMTVIVLALIYIERKFSARIQMRLGPMRVGPYGILQTVADTIINLGSIDSVLCEVDR